VSGVLALLLCAALLVSCGGSSVPAPTGGDTLRATVVRVTDGDTVSVSPEVSGEDSVRLIGVDAPETEGSPRGPQPYGEEAAAFAAGSLEGRSVELEFDVERVDDYGRALAYLYVGDEMFNETLLTEG